MRRNIIHALCDQHISLHTPTGTTLCLDDLAERTAWSYEIAEWAIFHNWSLRRFHWHNYIWNWHLLHYNSIRLKPKQDPLGNTGVIPFQKLKTEIIPFACIHWKQKLFFPFHSATDKRFKDLWMKLKFTANLPFAKLYRDFLSKKTFKIEKVWGIFLS